MLVELYLTLSPAEFSIRDNYGQNTFHILVELYFTFSLAEFFNKR